MTNIRQITFGAGVWLPRVNPAPMAIMPLLVEISGRGDELIPDLCRRLADLLPSWAVYGETMIPLEPFPYETLDELGRLKPGSFLVAVDENQQRPEYSDTNEYPDVSVVYVRLEQPMSQNNADLPLLSERRKEVYNALATLSGNL